MSDGLGGARDAVRFEVGGCGFDPGFETGEVFGEVFLEFASEMEGQEDESSDGADDGGKGKGKCETKGHAAVEPAENGIAEDSEEESDGNGDEEA